MMADAVFRFISFIHASSSHFSAMLSATWKILLPVLITCNVVLLISHYFAIGTRNPLITGGKARKLRKVLEILSANVGMYHPTIWSFGGYLQTIFGDLLRGRPRVKYISEDIVTPDGGIIRLDWTSVVNKDRTGGNQEHVGGKQGQAREEQVGSNEEHARGDQDHPEIDNVKNHDNEEQTWNDMSDSKIEESANIVLILPGLTGCSQSSYALQFAEDALSLGYRAVVLNHRGTRILPVTYRFNCAANSDDLEFVIELIHKRYPNSRICAVGVSLGGMITTNYLIRMSLLNKNSHLLAAFVVSVPYDSFVAADSLEKPVPWFLFNRFLTRKLQRFFVENKNALESRGIDVPKHHSTAMAKANTIRQFDAAVTAPMYGYKDVNDYYQAASIVEKPFECIKTPLLCLSADDDPFSPAEQIPVERIKNCDNVALLLTHTGGHVGFVEGLLPIGRGYMDRVYKEFIKAAFDQL